MRAVSSQHYFVKTAVIPACTMVIVFPLIVASVVCPVTPLRSVIDVPSKA